MKLIILLAAAVSLSAQSFYIATGNSSAYTDSTGQLWVAETGLCSGGTAFHVTSAISGTSDQTLYQYGRSGNSTSCTHTAAVGIYQIRLKFADTGGYSAPGQQIFNIFVNGTLQRANFDIFGTVRAQNTAYDVVLPLYAAMTGSITIMVSQVAGSAQLQAVSAIAQAPPGTLPVPIYTANYNSPSSTTSGIMEAIAANPGGKFQLPCGQVHISTPIAITTVIELMGCGADNYASEGTTIVNDDATGTVSTITVRPEHVFTSFAPYLHDFTIRCGAGARLCGSGVDVYNVYSFRAERIVVQESGNTGVLINTCIGCSLRQVSSSHAKNSGIVITDSIAITLDGIGSFDSSWANGYANLQINNSQNISVVNNSDFEACGGNPAHPGVTQCSNILISGTSNNVNIISSYSEIAAPAASQLIYIGPSVKGVVLLGNHLQDGVVVSDGTDISIGANYWYTAGIAATSFSAVSNQSTVHYFGTQTLDAGGITLSPADSGTTSALASAATLDAQKGSVTSESLTTAAAGTYTLTLTNAIIAASSVVTASVALGDSTQGTPQVVTVTPSAGSCVIIVKNIHATQAFNGTIVVSFAVN